MKGRKKMPHRKLKEIRTASGMSRKQFAEYFEIPYRTLQNWELGLRECPEYLLKLMEYKLKAEKITK
jgi:DNA-binding transcriptional regulator YiaG